MLIVTVLQFSQLFILARFLDPADFGLMAVMMVVIGFSQAFQDMQLNEGQTHQSISESLYVGAQTVFKWRNRYSE